MVRRRRAAAIYRRRRFLVFGGLILLAAAIAVGIWLFLTQPWADAAAEPLSTPTSTAVEETPTSEATVSETPSPELKEPSPEPTEETSPESAEEPSPEPTEEPTKAPPCRAVNIKVEAVTDADSYAAGELPELSISLTNTGSENCTLDVGSATQTFTVSSGTDVWWRSTDCQENPSSMVVMLAAGQTVPSATPVVWDRTRSSVDTCDQENRPRAPGGGASYHVAVSIGGFNSVATRQILLY